MRPAARIVLMAVVVTAFSVVADAGPVDFGKAVLGEALRARGQASDAIATRLRPGPPEAWSIGPREVTGADERGLMYGLLAAADQIRATGKLTEASGRPATPMRGIRTFLHNADLEKRWYHAREYWDAYFAMLAANRFNRFNLVFAHQTNYLAPPYPFWIALPEFPGIRVPGLTDTERARNLDTLRYIAQAAADHGIDFTLGIWQQNVQPSQTPTVEGLTRQNIGPYSAAALSRVLQLCPAIRSVQVRTNNESGIVDGQQVEFYRDHLFPAVKAAGRTLDLRAWAIAGGVIDAAKQVGVTTRVSVKYWAEDMGRPYQPAETYAGYSYLGFLEKPRNYDFFWEIWALGSHRVLLWGNPDFVRRAVPTLRLSGSSGFEIDVPLAQKGYGNRPGSWDVFTESQQHRVFWKWDFERYWLFYRLWGHLSYDPDAPDSVWMNEMRRRFGTAAPDVAEGYREASRVLNEIVAAHLADPNMYIWPEINPGGLIDSYKEVRPSDWRYIASIPEAVRNMLTGTASAKQTPRETADRLDGMAASIDAAVGRASSRITSPHLEWDGSRPDFEVLAHLARYHAHKQRAALAVEWFDATANRNALESARRDLTAALKEWEALVTLTDGLYSPHFATGPDDIGHWKDKLPYVRHDLEMVREREEILSRFGSFDFGFDFGGAVPPPVSDWRNTPFVRANTVAPRFIGVDPDTAYDDKTGYGWMRQAGSDRRAAQAVALTPYHEVRAVAKGPSRLPRDVLFGDSIRGEGGDVFVVKAPAGTYDVLFLSPNGEVRRENVAASGGSLRIGFQRRSWTVSGLVIKGPRTRAQTPTLPVHAKGPRPEIRHVPPTAARAGQPLMLSLRVAGVARPVVRLHYRALNQNETFRTIEGGLSFTIPAEQVTARWDLMYYFEILNQDKTGWFHPDPATATPYFVIPTR